MGQILIRLCAECRVVMGCYLNGGERQNCFGCTITCPKDSLYWHKAHTHGFCDKCLEEARDVKGIGW